MMQPLFALSIYWHLPVMIAIICLVYSATRFDEWGSIFQEALLWMLRMVGFLGGIAVVLYVLTLWIDS